MSVDVGIVAIIRLRDHTPPPQLLEALIAGGITRLEVTWRTPGAAEVISEWQDTAGVQFGAGTVRTAPQAAEAIGAGATFLVTPTIDTRVLDAALPRGGTVYCGASTPTEVERAHRHPAVAAVKVFPAGQLGGVEYVKAIADPLDDVPLLPTGGIGVEEAAAYARMGCVGVGVGGSLVNDDLVAGRDWAHIREGAARLVDAWNNGLARRSR